jgi:hypothetical protein
MVASTTGNVGVPQGTSVTLDELLQQPLSGTQGSTIVTPSNVDQSPSSAALGLEPLTPSIPSVPLGFEVLGDPQAPIKPLETDAGRALVSAIKEVLRG